MNPFDFDMIVIGSGFGGSVTSCRLVEKGYKVCLLERGRQWGMHEFPRRIHDIKEKFFWDPEDQQFGVMEFRDYPESDLMSVSASGLGGGSLIYANVLMRMPAEMFQGWPADINREKLDPYYDKVIETMEASAYPFETDPYYADTPKTKYFKEVAEKMGLEKLSEGETASAEFIFPDLAIRFKGNFPGHQSLNKHGALQSRCTKCGECDIGCNIHAKNTLDLNYIYRAQNLKPNPLEVRTHAQVTQIQPLSREPNSGYEVTYINPLKKSEITKLKTKKVIVSAGSLGSTSLLLHMKQKGLLPDISPMLGKKWCGNGDLEGTALDTKHNIDATNGPVITGAIRFRYNSYPDGFPHGLFIQDAGFPIGLAWYLSGKVPQLSVVPYYIKLGWRYIKGIWSRIWGTNSGLKELNIGDDISNIIDRGQFLRRAFLLLGMGRDRSDGEIQIRKDGQPIIKWKMKNSELHYERARFQMKRIANHLKGSFFDNPMTYIKKIIAVHPIGGCPMGNSSQDGVVNSHGEVFGHPGLYVVDASIIPTSLGPNPSLTIAALAEYISDQFPTQI